MVLKYPLAFLFSFICLFQISPKMYSRIYLFIFILELFGCCQTVGAIASNSERRIAATPTPLSVPPSQFWYAYPLGQSLALAYVVLVGMETMVRGLHSSFVLDLLLRV